MFRLRQTASSQCPLRHAISCLNWHYLMAYVILLASNCTLYLSHKWVTNHWIRSKEWNEFYSFPQIIDFQMQLSLEITKHRLFASVSTSMPLLITSDEHEHEMLNQENCLTLNLLRTSKPSKHWVSQCDTFSVDVIRVSKVMRALARIMFPYCIPACRPTAVTYTRAHSQNPCGCSLMPFWCVAAIKLYK